MLNQVSLCLTRFQLLLGILHGTYIFPKAPVYAWYLSATALLLNVSWSLHNVVAWLKNKPFLGRRSSLIYIGTVILVQPYWILEIYADFTYFANINKIFVHTRPLEALFRYGLNRVPCLISANDASSDPWWVFTTCSLFYNIKTRYEFGFVELIRISPRFGILLIAMSLSIIFTVLDILAVTDVLKKDLPTGIDPFWELAFVFKLLTDSVILDDFKTALDRLHAFKIASLSRLSAEDGVGAPSLEMRNAQRGPSFASMAIIANQNSTLVGQNKKEPPESCAHDVKAVSSHIEDQNIVLAR